MKSWLFIFVCLFALLSCDTGNKELPVNDQLDPLFLEEKNQDTTLPARPEKPLLPQFETKGYVENYFFTELNHLRKFLAGYYWRTNRIPHYDKKLENISSFEYYYVSVNCVEDSAINSICPNETLTLGFLTIHNLATGKAFEILASYDFFLGTERHTMSYSFEEDGMVILTEKIILAGSNRLVQAGQETIVASHTSRLTEAGYLTFDHTYRYIQQGDSLFSHPTANTESDSSTSSNTELPHIEEITYLRAFTAYEESFHHDRFYADSLLKVLTVYKEKLGRFSIYDVYEVEVNCYSDSTMGPICPDNYNGFSLLVLYEPFSKKAYVLNVEFNYYVDAVNSMRYFFLNDSTLSFIEEMATDGDEDENGDVGAEVFEVGRHTVHLAKDGAITISDRIEVDD